MSDRHRQRHYRRKDDDPDAVARTIDGPVRLEDEALARIEAAVAERLEAALASPMFQERVAQRLQEERARLEAAMATQLEAEKTVLLERKRAAQEAARKAQEDLERLIEENRRKVEEAQQAAADAGLGGNPGSSGDHSSAIAPPVSEVATTSNGPLQYPAVDAQAPVRNPKPGLVVVETL